MQCSLTLEDRDKRDVKDGVGFRGYAISHAATPIHFPTPHDILGVDVIDDFYHDASEDPQTLATNSAEAAALFHVAEPLVKGAGTTQCWWYARRVEVQNRYS